LSREYQLHSHRITKKRAHTKEQGIPGIGMNTPPGDTKYFSTQLNGSDALAPICEINEQCLQMLASVSHQTQIPSEPFLHHLFSLMGAMDAPALKAAAHFPFLLVDFGFRDPQWWRRITSKHRCAADERSWLVPFPRATACKLSRATLMLAWHTVRTDTETALVLLGISQPVAEYIGALRLQDIDRIADRHHRRLRPRWEDQPAVWRQLLMCSRAADVNSAHEFVLHALQLTTANALPAATITHA
jgi:hypothetical protein